MKTNTNDELLISDLRKIINEEKSRNIFFDRIDKYVFNEMEDEYYQLSNKAIKDIEDAEKEFKNGKGIELMIKEKEKILEKYKEKEIFYEGYSDPITLGWLQCLRWILDDEDD